MRFRTRALVIFMAAIGAACSKTEVPLDPWVRSTEAGLVRGYGLPNGGDAWFGVPYAKPPMNELRWRPPQPVKPWSGVLDVKEPAHVCAQFVSPLTRGIADPDGDRVVGKEDCLYLNIYAPTRPPGGKPLPVMFWIFGGSNTGGHASQYDGSKLARMHDVVVVVVNYRLGALGWFRHPAILEAAADEATRSGNWGDLDLQHALHWVQKNIANFGGDPGNVTIFGQSAGGQNVLSLLLSPTAKGLFHKAIVQSGSHLPSNSVAAAVNFSDDAEAGSEFSGREIVNSILVRDGKAADRGAAKQLQLKMSDADIGALLYAQDAAALLKLYSPEGEHPYWATQKIVDGAVLPLGYGMELFEAGRYNRVPVMLGSTRDDANIYYWGEPRWREVLQKSPRDYAKFMAYLNEADRANEEEVLARALSAQQAGGVFSYRFDWDELGELQGIDLGAAVGASHSFEVAFMFADWSFGFLPLVVMYPEYPEDRKPARVALSKSMTSYWTNFAYTGAPARGRDSKEVEWQAWQNAAGSPKTLLLDTEKGGGIRMTTQEIVVADLKRRMLADSFDDQRLHCEAYVNVFQGENFDKSEYAGLGKKGCAEYPPESFE
jgi:para-nitrobenzyl esterase